MYNLIHLQCERSGLDPWVGKIPWRRAWQPTPVFLPGESSWTEELGRLQSMRLQRVGHDRATKCRALYFCHNATVVFPSISAKDTPAFNSAVNISFLTFGACHCHYFHHYLLLWEFPILLDLLIAALSQ